MNGRALNEEEEHAGARDVHAGELALDPVTVQRDPYSAFSDDRSPHAVFR